MGIDIWGFADSFSKIWSTEFDVILRFHEFCIKLKEVIEIITGLIMLINIITVLIQIIMMTILNFFSYKSDGASTTVLTSADERIFWHSRRIDSRQLRAQKSFPVLWKQCSKGNAGVQAERQKNGYVNTAYSYLAPGWFHGRSSR